MPRKPLVGINLKNEHFLEFKENHSKVVDWFEVHSENYINCSGKHFLELLKIRELYPMSLHGVGLSLGSADGISIEHLQNLRNLVNASEPFLLSEHLSWSGYDGKFVPDLLPIPYNNQTLQIFCDNLNKAQDFLKTEIMVENPSSYFEYKDSFFTESEFLVKIFEKTGSRILLDLNNAYLSCYNNGWDVIKYLEDLPSNSVGEIHLASYTDSIIAENKILKIDSHDGIVSEEVLELCNPAISRFSSPPILLEWDNNIPTLDALLKEASRIADYLGKKEGLIYA